HPVLLEAMCKCRAKKLTAPIAVKDQTFFWTAPTEGSVDCCTRQPRVSNRTESPGQDPARVLVEYGRQKPPTPADGEICHIAHPDLIGSSRYSSLHTVRMLTEPSMRPGLPTVDTHDTRPQPTRAHQTLHPPTTDPVSLHRESPMEPWTSIGPTTP